MTNVEQPPVSQVCQECAGASDLVRTMYVHLCSGQVKAVTGVTDVNVTQSQIILQRGDGPPATFPRRDVYFACCDENEQPSPF